MGSVLDDYRVGLAFVNAREAVEDDRGRVEHRRAHDLYDIGAEVDPQNPFHRYFTAKFVARHIDFWADLSLTGGGSRHGARDQVRGATSNKYRARALADLGEPPVNTVLFDKINGISQLLDLMSEIERRQGELSRVDAANENGIFTTQRPYVFASSRGRKGGGSPDIKQVYQEGFLFGAKGVSAAWGGGAVERRYVIHHFHGR